MTTPLSARQWRGLPATCLDIEVVGEAKDGVQAVAKAAELLPDLILMDIQMPRLDGLEATRRIKATHPSLKIVMLTVLEEARTLSDARKTGADGYLLKGMDPDEFLARVREISQGNAPQTHGDTERTVFASVPDLDAGTSKACHPRPLVSPERDRPRVTFFPAKCPLRRIVTLRGGNNISRGSIREAGRELLARPPL